MLTDIPDDRGRTDTWAQRLKKKTIKENSFTILHCYVPDFKYGSSLCLETSENTKKKSETGEFWGTLV